MDEITRIKYPGEPLTQAELDEFATIKASDQNKAIRESDAKLKEYLEAKRARSLRPKQQ
jgi:hypothetical protein